MAGSGRTIDLRCRAGAPPVATVAFASSRVIVCRAPQAGGVVSGAPRRTSAAVRP